MSIYMPAIPPALADLGPGLLQHLGACCASVVAAHLPAHPTALLSSAERAEQHACRQVICRYAPLSGLESNLLHTSHPGIACSTGRMQVPSSKMLE